MREITLPLHSDLFLFYYSIFLEQYIYFVRILRLKFAKFHEHCRNKPKAENLKRTQFCVGKSVNMVQFMFLT